MKYYTYAVDSASENPPSSAATSVGKKPDD
jgi:hypothetical protein